MFLPSYKSNLLSAMKKYALAEALVKFDEAEQNNIVEQNHIAEQKIHWSNFEGKKNIELSTYLITLNRKNLFPLNWSSSSSMFGRGYARGATDMELTSR